MSKKQNQPLPAHIEEQRTRAFVNKDVPTYTDTNYHHSVYHNLGFDNSFDFEEFKQNFKIEVQLMNEEEMIFDLIGVDAPIANALRRILISEVPTMAIEHVYITENSSIIQDEVLAHRLGLIPIKADPRWFEWPSPDGATDKNTIEFTLNIKCERKKDYKESYPDHLKYEHSRVYSGDMVWVPHGVQAEEFVGENAIKPVHNDILIAKLRPGQVIELNVRCCKGIGKDHAKFSPVATATYRLLPEITITGNVTNQKAVELVKKCPMKVFDIEDIGGVRHATVANPRNCSMCRECIREPGWEKLVKLRRKKDHFIFHVESTQILHPKILFEEAVKKLLEKIELLRSELQKLSSNEDDTERTAGAAGE